MGDIFWWLVKFQIFLGVLEIPDIFWGLNGRCWARAAFSAAVPYSHVYKSLNDTKLLSLKKGESSVEMTNIRTELEIFSTFFGYHLIFLKIFMSFFLFQVFLYSKLIGWIRG